MTAPAAVTAVLRAQFPALHQQVRGEHPLVYLDSAATTQKPQAVLDALVAYYSNDNSNVHRAAHQLAERATRAFEDARQQVATAIGAAAPREVIWTRGTTEAINLVASGWGDPHVTADQNIVISIAEHHSNFVPWQQLALRSGAQLRIIPLREDCTLDMERAAQLIDDHTAIIAVAHVSNALGTINPVAELSRLAHAHGAICVIDGAQGPGHGRVDIATLDCDFYALSGHKMYGPTGIGALWGREALLDATRPVMFGGEMIETVSVDGSSWNQLPWKFEAGTPNIAGAIGLGAACRWLADIDLAAAAAEEQRITRLAVAHLGQTPGVRLVGPTERTGAVSFLVEGAHPHDVGTLLDQQGIAVRTGHHCTMPLMQALNIPGTVRASFALYNTEDDVHALLTGLEKVRRFL